MKIKLFIAALLFTWFASSFAATGSGYRVLSEELHSAPGFNFQVESVPPGTAAAQKKILQSGRTKTNVPSRSGNVNQSITVDGYHDISIYNSTNKSQTYEMNVSLDCESAHSYFRRYVEVHAGGSYSDSAHTFGTVQKSSAGSYRIDGETKLSGESSDSSRDSNKLYIR